MSGRGQSVLAFAAIAFILWLVWRELSSVSSSNNTVSSTDPLQVWADAIFHHEGGNPGNLNVVNNNPGDLKYAGQLGATGADSKGFAVFPDFQTGYDALIRQLKKYVADFPNYNLLQIMTHYLGGDPATPKITGEGDPFAYANDVAGKLGESSTGRTLGQIFGGQ